MFHIPRLGVRLEAPIQVLFNLLFCLDFLPPNMESNSLKALLLWIARPRTVDELGQVLTIWCLHVTPGSWTPNVPLPRNLQVPFSHMLSGLYLPPSANSPFQITWTNSCSQLFRNAPCLHCLQFNSTNCLSWTSGTQTCYMPGMWNCLKIMFCCQFCEW